jgi:hypothetical protein
MNKISRDNRNRNNELSNFFRQIDENNRNFIEWKYRYITLSSINVVLIQVSNDKVSDKCCNCNRMSTVCIP